jgi:hypothetical protein
LTTETHHTIRSEGSELAAKIRALLAKTVDNGCTEAEAMAAAVKAKQLMDQYQVGLSDIELEEEGYVRGTAQCPEARKFNAQDWLASAIEAYTETRSWKTHAGYQKKWRYVFFGLRSDVEFANWLLKSLECFAWQKAEEYAVRSGNTDYLSKRNFVMGCCERISERLREETTARTRKQTTAAAALGGRALVVVKYQLVQREYDKLGLKLGKLYSSGFTCGGADGARGAGRSAGDSASFGRPVGGSPRGQIGRS